MGRAEHFPSCRLHKAHRLTLSCVLAFSTSSGVTSWAMRTKFCISTCEKSCSFSGGTTAYSPKRPMSYNSTCGV